MTYDIETKMVRYTYHHDTAILEARYKKDLPTITEALAEAIVEERLLLQRHRPVRLMFHFDSSLDVTPAARTFFSSPRALEGIAANAILCGAFGEYAIMQFLTLFTRNGPPMSIFRDQKNATKWLLKTPCAVGIEDVRQVIEEALLVNDSPVEQLQLTAALKAITPSTGAVLPALTMSETLIVEYMSQGLTTKEMAGNLNKSPRTIESQRRDLYAKMGVKNGTELMAKLTRLGRI